MSQDHIVKQYDIDLENIRNRVLQMGGLVEQQIIKAMTGLVEGDRQLIEQTIDNDHQVNRSRRLQRVLLTTDCDGADGVYHLEFMTA